MQEDQKDPALNLRQARADAQRGIEDLEKASEALRLYGTTSEGVRYNPARQEHLDEIERRLVKARYEITEIERLIEEIETAWGE